MEAREGGIQEGHSVVSGMAALLIRSCKRWG